MHPSLPGQLVRRYGCERREVRPAGVGWLVVWVQLNESYTSKDVATKETVLDVVLVPSGLFIVKESWPFLGHQCPAWVPVLKVCNDAIKQKMSNVLLSRVGPTCLGPFQTLPGAGEVSRIGR